jgi:hypothetical protein
MNKVLKNIFIGRKIRLVSLITTLAMTSSLMLLVPIQADAASIWVNLTGTGTNEWSALATSADGSKVIGGMNNQDIFISTDSGASWTDQSTLGADRWQQVAMSSDGSKLIVGGLNQFAVSTNSGSTWNKTSKQTYSVSMSANGVKMARVTEGIIYLSSDSGQTWVRGNSSNNFNLIAYSANGNLLIAGKSDGHLFTSSDDGANWVERVATSNTSSWSNFITNSTGSIIFASHFQDPGAGDLYKSTDSGATWNKQLNYPGRQLNQGQLACDASCTKIFSNPWYVDWGAHNFGYPYGIFSSSDGGATWTKESVSSPRLERGYAIAMSSNGKRLYASSNTNSVNRLLTYNSDYLPSNNASFTLNVNGSPLSDGQTLNLGANSNTVSVEIITADPMHQTSSWFGETNCGNAGNCFIPDVQLDNYVNNISGIDTISISVTAEDRVTTLTKTINVSQQFTHRTILNYNAGYYGYGITITNERQQITTGSGLPASATRADSHFINWSDGSVANPRTDSVGKDISVWPNFGLNAESGKVARNYLANEHGYINGPGDCPGSCQQITPGQDATSVTAIPDDGYDFSRWNDGSKANPRIDTAVQSSADLLAIFVRHLDITLNEETHEQVAAIPTGTSSANIPASADIPATTLNFANAASGSATVTIKPITNPVATSASPFKMSGSTKIVDIKVDGITGPVTVCLDGGPTDSIFHFVGGKWEELPSRTYANGQVCGVTTSFSPFAAAEPTPVNASPDAPTSVVATATGKRTATVTFSAPSSNGGAVITSYTAISTPGSITKTLTQAGSGTFNIDGLQPGTSYTFAVTAKNANGTSVAGTSNSIKTSAADVASLTSITFTDDGSGTAGKLTWVGSKIDAVLYTGPAGSYPGPFTLGAFSSSWNGSIRNLTPETSYTISIYAVSVDGVGESKSLTFKTGVKTDLVKNLNYWNTWLTANTYSNGEAARLFGLLTKFNSLETSPIRSFIKVPVSLASTVSATSLTPKSCSVVSTTAKVDAGMVKALTKETCTISYTVSGSSRAPATLVKDFVFKKVG